jgi:hypothetical protein
MIPAISSHDGPTSMLSRGPAFTTFNRLPIEVRLQIWEAALPGPRLINIKENRLRKTKREHIAETRPDLDPTAFPPGNLLGVTSDSKPHLCSLPVENPTVSLQRFTSQVLPLRIRSGNTLRLPEGYLVSLPQHVWFVLRGRGGVVGRNHR